MPRARLVLLCLGGLIAVMLLWVLALAGTRTVGTPSDGTAPQRPNVLLISLDTVRPDHLGCYGYGRNTSPNLDSFAKQCALFTDAYAQAPWTLPSHMSLFTSMLPSHNRVEDLGQKLSDDIPTLAQIMRKHGYATAALVNNGQMRAHWGFDRGFDLWREYEVDTPEGTCENVTSEALKWFESAPRQPFFLFLHYYDPHDPYSPPERYREAFGSSLSGAEARQVVWHARYPGEEIDDPKLMQQVIGSYDGEIAWLDSELGKIFNALPPNTLVVVFSDHGEAFEEHGWTTHGATLYEEEVRVALMLRPPAEASWPAEIHTAVMLLDVAPTILSLCGAEPPLHYEGRDLSPLLEGKTLPERPILAETKRVLEGRVLKMVMHHPWKLIYSVLDGGRELYKLPDEEVAVPEQDVEEAGKLLEAVREWLSEEDFWVVYAKGSGSFEATLTLQDGGFSVVIPVGIDPDRDGLTPSRDGREIHWLVYPGGQTKALVFELAPRDARVSFDFKVAGERRKDMVFVGAGLSPLELPFEFKEEDLIRSPIIEKAFEPGQDGFHLTHYRGLGASARSATGIRLDARTIEQLRSLGYLE